MVYDPTARLRKEMAANGASPEEIEAAVARSSDGRGSFDFLNPTSGNFAGGLFGKNGLIGDGGASSRAAARNERNAGIAALEGLRGEIPGAQLDEFSIFDYPDIANAVMSGEMSQQEALAQVNQQRQEALQFKPEMYGDPEEVDFQGYEGATLGRSNMWGANADPRSIEAQEMALQGFQDIANQGGLTAIDRARIAEARAGEDQWLRGQRGAQMANLQARGLGGSGAELASAFDMQQSSANRNALSGMQTEALAQQRAMDALGMTGSLGGQMRSQSFGEASDRAGAQDAFDTFNVGVTNDSRRFSADVENQQEGSNVGARRDRSIRNTGLANEAQGYNLELPWRQYGAEADITGALANERFGQAGAERAAATESANRWRQMAGTAAGAAFGGAPGAAAGSQATGGSGGYASPNFNPSTTYNPNFGDGGGSGYKDKTYRYKPGQGVK